MAQAAQRVLEEDSKIREQMILDYLPYVNRIVNRIAVHLPAGVDSEELNHVGVIGLIQAVDRYDPTRDNKFSTFAAFRIRGAVLSELRARDFISRSERCKIREVEAAVRKLEQINGRAPDDGEIAALLNIDLAALHRIKTAASLTFVNFDELGDLPLSARETRAAEWMREDSDILKQAGLNEIRTALAEAVGELPQKEKMLISLYYADELTMKEVGQVLGVTESRVSQLHSQAILRLRSKLRSRQLLDD